MPARKRAGLAQLGLDELKKVFAIYTPIVIVGIIGTLLFSKHIVNLIAPAYLPGLLIFKTLICFCFITGYIHIYVKYLSALAKMKELIIWTSVLFLALIAVSFLVIGI